MDEHGGLRHRRVYLFVEEEAIKTGMGRLGDGGFSLMGKKVKSKRRSLFSSDTCSLGANNKILTDAAGARFLSVAFVELMFHLEAHNSICTWEW